MNFRETVRKAFGSDIAESVSILYGGSVKPDNKEIFSKPDVDGGLIGGAALKADDFVAIVNAI
jgi:triosephosphate isomerase